ncbi:MAG: SDR family NAD(P)-dependent oxidoreductase [Granulosicoccaceae bacterium]
MRVFITAGGSGIGLAMAEMFIGQGASVAICDNDQSAVHAFQQKHTGALGFVADVCDETRIQAVFTETVDAFGGLDVVAANAGTGGPAGAVEDIELADWRACISVNLDGAFIVAKQASRHFKAQGNGLLLFSSSTSGLFGAPHRSPYCAAKWALAGLTKTLAMELGPWRSCQCHCPRCRRRRSDGPRGGHGGGVTRGQ